MKKEKDLIAARYLNAHIMAPSNCFDLIDVPSVSQIICGNDLPSRMIARQLAEVIRKQTFVYPVIYSGPEFALLDMAKDVDSQAENFVSLLCKGGFNLEETLIVARMDMFLTLRGNARLNNVLFCIRDYFMSDKNFAYKPFLTRAESMPKYFGGKRLKNCDYVVVYDDDMTSAFEGAKLWWELKRLYDDNGPSGKKRKLICLGGKGKLSTFLYSQTEGQMLKATVKNLYVEVGDIIVLDGGNNTGDNLKALNHKIGSDVAIVAVTQRLSAILYASQEFQFPDMKLLRLTIYEKVDETLKWLNGMKLRSGEPALHFWAHVIRRCDAYEGKFMIKLEGIDAQARISGEQLQKKYLIKQPGHMLRTIMQYIPILADLLRHRQDVRSDYAQAVKDCQSFIREKYRTYVAE